jgi:hypothetical protein
MNVSGNALNVALQSIIDGVDDSHPIRKAVKRCVSAWGEPPGPGDAKRLRRCLRSRGDSSCSIPRFVTAGWGDRFRQDLRDAGLDIRDVDERTILLARPWRPRWRTNEIWDPPPRDRRTPDEASAAEPWLRWWPQWRSQAQKEALWSVLHLPEGGTAQVVLPTGAGKSLCFQALHGLAGGGQVNLLVVPTVALALDQERRFAEL